MSERIIVALQDESNKTNLQDVEVKSVFPQNYSVPYTRKEDMGRYIHMKNAKKFTHLYELEKYFRSLAF